MAGSARTAVGDFFAGQILQFTHGGAALDVPKGVHAGNLRGGDLDRRFFDKRADHGQRPRAETDLRVTGDDRLHVLSAAAGEHRIDLEIVLFVKPLFLGDIDRQRDREQNPMGNDEDNFGARRGGPSR